MHSVRNGLAEGSRWRPLETRWEHLSGVDVDSSGLYPSLASGSPCVVSFLGEEMSRQGVFHDPGNAFDISLQTEEMRRRSPWYDWRPFPLIMRTSPDRKIMGMGESSRVEVPSRKMAA